MLSCVTANTRVCCFLSSASVINRLGLGTGKYVTKGFTTPEMNGIRLTLVGLYLEKEIQIIGIFFIAEREFKLSAINYSVAGNLLQ